MELNKSDIERITESVIRELKLVIDKGDFTMPNCRTISLTLHGRVIDSATFDVADQSEYED